MTPADTLDLARDAIYVLLVITLPIMAVALIVGLAVALLQALTQVQEITLVFVPKIVAMFLALLIFLPFMGMSIGDYVHRLSSYMTATSPAP